MEEYSKKQLKATTYSRYQGLLKRILPALGHLKLNQIQPHHLIAFENNLREVGVKDSTKCHCKIDFKQYLKKRKLTKVELCKMAEVGISNLNSITQDKNINVGSARKISTALSVPMLDIFNIIGNDKVLAEKSILHHHRLISTILQDAVEWQLILSNPAKRMKPPKTEKVEIKALTKEEVQMVVKELYKQDDEDLKCLLMLAMFTGMRRGEMLGLEWQDVDMAKKELRIVRNSIYTKNTGIQTTTPKTKKSMRKITIPTIIIELLQEHKLKQSYQQAMAGSDWVDTQRIFTQWNGMPMHPDTMSEKCKKFLNQLGLEGYHLHCLRHTHASLLIADGADIQTVSNRLGHEQTSTTLNMYVHCYAAKDREMSDAMERMVFGE